MRIGMGRRISVISEEAGQVQVLQRGRNVVLVVHGDFQIMFQGSTFIRIDIRIVWSTRHARA